MTSSPKDPIKLVPKGWGYEKWIVNSPLYCGKILWFCKDKKCSWHYHKKKDEVFYVRSGRLAVYWSWNDEFEYANLTELGPGDKFHVPPGMRHRSCTGKLVYAQQFCVGGDLHGSLDA